MWKIIKISFIVLFFIRGMISIDKPKIVKNINKTIDENNNLVLHHASELFYEFMAGSMSCHGSHGSHSSHSSHVSHHSHRSHYSG